MRLSESILRHLCDARVRGLCGVGIAVVTAAAAPPLNAGSWKLGAGVDYTSGDYGGQEDVVTLYARNPSGEIAAACCRTSSLSVARCCAWLQER